MSDERSNERLVSVMNIRNVAKASVLALGFGFAGTASASPSLAERCQLNENYKAVTVAPFRMEEDFGLGGYTTLRGAQVYVAAKPGLTAQWITLSVEHEIARLSKSDDAVCRPAVKDVKVSVVPAGGGFWVFLSARDERSAKMLLQWAQNVVPTWQEASK